MSSTMLRRRTRSMAAGGMYTVLKRMFDLAFAILLLIVLAPLLVMIGLMICVDSPGPAIYRQERMGRDGSRFTILKFRTMRIGTPVLSTEDMQQQQAIPFTRLGPILRKSSLDELPQLINIARGEMSFIGPRPSLISQEDINSLRAVSSADCVRPGITGLAQVNGRDDLPADLKVSYDTDYCRTMSFSTDVKILIKTALAIVSTRGNK